MFANGSRLCLVPTYEKLNFQLKINVIMKTEFDNNENEALNKTDVSRSFFADAQDFNQFMINEKPKEIWLDEFMEDEPYIILSFNNGVKFRGIYNHQCLLGGDNSDFTWLFESGMYVKTFC